MEQLPEVQDKSVNTQERNLYLPGLKKNIKIHVSRIILRYIEWRALETAVMGYFKKEQKICDVRTMQ